MEVFHIYIENDPYKQVIYIYKCHWVELGNSNMNKQLYINHNKHV